MPTTSEHPGRRLRNLMDDHCVGAPGAFNGLCAMAVRDAGFEAAYVSGGATSVAAGVPDVGVLTLEHFARVVREVVDGTRPAGGGAALPVLADADTGFGEAEMVRRTVIEYHRAGAAGLHLEDQVFPKRCGHLEGKRLIPLDHACEKIAEAVRAARDCSGEGGFVICARTDARSVEGMDAVISRARAYVEAGADMIFPEGLGSPEEFGAVSAALTGPGATGGRPYLLANMTEFGKTPLLPLSSFASMGYALVIYPVTTLRVAMGAVTRALSRLKAEGEVRSFLDGMQTREELYRMVGYEPGTAWRAPM